MRGVVVVLLAGIAIGSACDEESGLADRLQEARGRWARDGPPDYEMVLFRGCFCGPEGRGPVLVTVVDGEVASRTYVDGGGVVDPQMAPLFPEVEGLFALASEAIRRADRVEAEFDPDLGFPRRLTIDWEANVADEEVDFQVERLTPVSRSSRSSTPRKPSPRWSRTNGGWASSRLPPLAR